MKVLILSIFILSISSVSMIQATSPEDVTEKTYDALNEAITDHITILDNGLLYIEEKAEESLPQQMFSYLNTFVDILNQEVQEGTMLPITPDSLAGLRPTRYCECLLGCCIEGYCWIIWPTYISREPCQP